MPQITLIAPASPLPNLNEKISHEWTRLWSDRGYTLKFADSCFKSERFLAGSDTLRATDIQAAFSDPETTIIMALKGGYGSLRLLDKLDYNLIRKNPKPFVGFSDNTALNLALLAQAGLPSITGFNASFMSRISQAPLLFQTLQEALTGHPQRFYHLKPLSHGHAKGRLIGGTLSLLCHLIGTPYLPDMKGAILVLEDVGEEPYKIDKMLTHLRLSGLFHLISGIVLGRFENCLSKDAADGSVETVLGDHFSALSIPVMTGLPYGHTTDHAVFPLGTQAVLDTTTSTLEINPLPF